MSIAIEVHLDAEASAILGLILEGVCSGEVQLFIPNAWHQRVNQWHQQWLREKLRGT